MGGQQSVPSPSGAVVQAPKSQGLPDENSMQMALESLAAEVYSNVHERLLTIQQQELNDANAIAGEVRKKLDPLTFKIQSDCVGEEKELLTCLQTNKSTPLVCAPIVTAFEKCASKAAVSK